MKTHYWKYCLLGLASICFNATACDIASSEIRLLANIDSENQSQSRALNPSYIAVKAAKSKNDTSTPSFKRKAKILSLISAISLKRRGEQLRLSSN